MSEQIQKAVRLSREAQQALEVLSPVFDQIFESLNQGMAKAPIGQDQAVLAIHAAMQTTQKVRDAITSIVANGVLAEHALIQADILKGEQ